MQTLLSGLRVEPPGAAAPAVAPGRDGLRNAALTALVIADPAEKTSAVARLVARLDAFFIDTQAAIDEPPALPGRPARPALVAPKDVPQRSIGTLTGRAALLHAVAHIEFNAINLALDAVWRFAGMPRAYYLDWARVAGEEAMHFGLLREHLRRLGHDYGDFPAHDGLWTMTAKTAGDPLARMALVPRTLEARGLDATPPMQAKLAQAGDQRAADILGVILRDEIGHVTIGNRWYRYLCERAGLDPVALYPQLAERYGAPKPRPPFNLSAREAAGFTADELALLGG